MPEKRKLEIFLASSSPRRKELLSKIFKDFYVINSSSVKEDLVSSSLEELVLSNAFKKAYNAVKEVKNISYVIIAADTIVAIGQKILGKPSSIEEAKYFLRELSDKAHYVYTGVVLIVNIELKSDNYSFTEKTKVTFNSLTDEQINYYVEKFSPLDKAGAYGIQEVPVDFIKSVEGEYENVIGLPLIKLGKLLNRLSENYPDIDFNIK
jgi:septum formation protein